MVAMSLEATADALAQLGPFFATEPVKQDAGWRPVRDLLQADVLGERVDYVGSRISAIAGIPVERRVAASTMSLGLFARLVSPVLGARVLDLDLPRPTLDCAWWRPTEAGPWPFGLTGDATRPDFEELFGDTIAPLVETTAEVGTLSERVLWGNVASAVFGAARMLGTARPDLEQASLATAEQLLRGPLQGTGELRESFVRASCCLYYRVPGGGYCADCVLDDR